ncbi:YggT family protein [Lacticaseibacillus sp. GG6-2]
MIQQLIFWIWRLLTWVLDAYSLAIAVFVLMSWFPGAYESRLGQWLGRIVDPYLAWFRRFIPAIAGMDFSPLLAFGVIYLFQKAINIIFFAVVS